MTTFLFFASVLIFSAFLGYGFGVLTGLAVTACTWGDQTRAEEKGTSSSLFVAEPRAGRAVGFS
jgi:hypothetical protein